MTSLNDKVPSNDKPSLVYKSLVYNSLVYKCGANIFNEDLNALFAAAWPQHTPRDFQPILRHSLTYITAHADILCPTDSASSPCSAHERLIGFVNVAWDGGIHAFLLDTTVHPQWQRRGIGRELVRRAVDAAHAAHIRWLHVDYAPPLDSFYRACGFRATHAGLIDLTKAAQADI